MFVVHLDLFPLVHFAWVGVFGLMVHLDLVHFAKMGVFGGLVHLNHMGVLW